MPGLLAAIIAIIVGLVVGIGGGVVLVQAKGGGNGFPVQNTAPIDVYGKG